MARTRRTTRASRAAEPEATYKAARSFRELIVWKKSHALVLEVYRVTKSFPREELFGLVSQMRRASVSVPANIAEAFARRTRPDKARLFNTAQASLEELRYFFILSGDLGYLSAPAFEAEAEEISRMLSGYVAKLSSGS